MVTSTPGLAASNDFSRAVKDSVREAAARTVTVPERVEEGEGVLEALGVMAVDALVAESVLPEPQPGSAVMPIRPTAVIRGRDRRFIAGLRSRHWWT